MLSVLSTASAPHPAVMTTVASQTEKKTKDYDCACQNRETYGHTPQADLDGVVAVDIEGLERPEHEVGEGVGSGKCGDDEREGDNASVLLRS